MFPKEFALVVLQIWMASLVEGAVSAHTVKNQNHPNHGGVIDTPLLCRETVNEIRLHPCRVLSLCLPYLVHGGIGCDAGDLGCSAGAAST